MKIQQTVNETHPEVLGPTPGAWGLVFLRELHELWLGGKAPVLLLLFAILLGIMSYLFASNSELSLIPPKEMVYLTIEAAIAVGVFIGLIIGADSISGERERATLESLLLTPVRRRQIIAGKFLAAMSPWPVALAISSPYLFVLSQGDEAFGQAMVWGAILGTLLAASFTAFGILVSVSSNTIKSSMFVSLTVYLLFLIPTQFPGTAQTGTMGRVIKRVNPMESVIHILQKIVVNNRTLEEIMDWFAAPLLFVGLMLGLLVWQAPGRLRLDAESESGLLRRLSRAVGLTAVACTMLSLATSPALALPDRVAPWSLQVSIDKDYAVAKNGDTVLFNTVVTNTGAEESPPLIVAMNIVNLAGEGDPVDPEDWSPERAQYIESLEGGESASQAWRVNTILEGDYMVYMVVIPTPDGPEATTQPITSSGIHITVNRYIRLNPGGVLPYAIGGPIVVMLAVFMLYRFRRRKIDEGVPPE